VSAQTLLDVAGAHEGGARRFLSELDAYLTAQTHDEVHLVGRDRRLSSTWLVQREVEALRRPGLRRTVALNNVALGARRRVTTCVLLRNPLHFYPLREIRTITTSARVQLQLEAAIVRRRAAHADEIVVPTQEMAGRVLLHLPGVESRLRVRLHPLSKPDDFVRCPTGAVFLMPALFAPWKGLEGGFAVLRRALDLVEHDRDVPVEIRVTATADQLRHALGGETDSRIVAISRLTPIDLDRQYETARAVLYPTKLESFGYPLAEARLRRVPVIARDTELTREVAGPWLLPVDSDDAYALARAMSTALDDVAGSSDCADNNPFDPTSYFDDLLGNQRSTGPEGSSTDQPR